MVRVESLGEDLAMRRARVPSIKAVTEIARDEPGGRVEA